MRDELRSYLRQLILELGMEVETPVPEILDGIGSELADQVSEPWKALSEVFTELVNEKKILLSKGRWDDGETVDVGWAQALELLSDRRSFFFGKDPNEERLYFVNVDRLIPGYKFPY